MPDETDTNEVVTDKEIVRHFTVTAKAIGPGEAWRSKEEVADKERESRQYWQGVEDDNRQAILVLTRDALLRLVEDPDVWVPTSIEPKSQNRLDIFISIHLAEVDDEVLRRRVETERMIATTTSDLVKLHGELSDEEKAARAAQQGS